MSFSFYVLGSVRFCRRTHNSHLNVHKNNTNTSTFNVPECSRLIFPNRNNHCFKNLGWFVWLYITAGFSLIAHIGGLTLTCYLAISLSLLRLDFHVCMTQRFEWPVDDLTGRGSAGVPADLKVVIEIWDQHRPIFILCTSPLFACVIFMLVKVLLRGERLTQWKVIFITLCYFLFYFYLSR